MACSHVDYVEGCPYCASTQVRSTSARATLSARDPADDGPPRGTQVGRYVLLDQVGEGGMGWVYVAWDPELDRKVAIKILRAQLADAQQGTEGQTRLLREAQAMARLSDPHVVPIYDVGTFGNGVFIAMEYVDGQTLSEWLHETPHSWKQVVAMLSDAGAGLAAAHRAGLIHRDFKPANILIGREGRARVGDFGLARAQGGPELAPFELRPTSESAATISAGADPTPSEVLSNPLTIAGVMMGTPGYMAPEQYAGGAVSALSDQFSFCCTLYEAVYGTKPFSGGGESITEMADKATSGGFKPPPPEARVPARVWRVIQRGLQPDPGKRFPSMDELLVELGRDPTRARRQGVAAVVAVLLAAGVVVGARLYVARQNQVCRGAPGKLAGAWDPVVSGNIQRALEATKLPYATKTWTNIQARLDAYADTWSKIYVEACEATRRRGEQSEQVMDLRMECLDESVRELSALTAVLSKADGKVAENAVTAVRGLPDLGRCSDVAALREPVPLPRDPALRKQIDEAQIQLAAAKSLNAAGKYKEARTLVDALTPRAVALAYPPFTANTYKLLGDNEFSVKSILTPQALEAYEHAFSAAEAARLDEVAARSLIEIAHGEVADHARAPEARLLMELAHGKLARVLQPDSLEAAWHSGVGRIAQAEGKADEAIEHYQKALAIQEKRDDRLAAATALADLGWTYVDKGNLEGAREALEKALSLREKELGPEHPVVLTSLNALARQAQTAGRFDESIAYLRRALTLSDRIFGPEGARHCMLSNNLANTLLNMGGHEQEALREAQGAYAMCKRVLGSDHPGLPNVRGLLATALREAGHPKEALDEHRAALADFDRLPTKQPSLSCTPLHELVSDLLVLGRNKEALATAKQGVRCMVDGKVEAQNLSQAYQVLGQAQLKTGDSAGAALSLAKTVDLRVAAKVDPSDIAEAKFLLAQAQWKANRAAAKALANEAEQVYRTRGKVEKAREIDAWRIAHR